MRYFNGIKKRVQNYIVNTVNTQIENHFQRVNSDIHLLNQKQGEFHQKQGEFLQKQGEFHETLERLSSKQGNIEELLVNLSAGLANLSAGLANLSPELANLSAEKEKNTQKIESILCESRELSLDLIKLIMSTRLVVFKDKWSKQVDPGGPLLGKVEPFEVYLKKYKALHPHLFDLWASINMSSITENYRNDPANNCGVEDRYATKLFAGLIAPYLQGRVLDIGCGPWPVGYYLRDYPIKLISGIDPLDPYSPHPFEFVQGFAEFLPWEDNSFDVVITATSLDHVLSLELTLSEIVRVLKPNGYYLSWDFFDNTLNKPYHPEKQPAELVDAYHLFHFSEQWHDELMQRYFKILEKVNLNAYDLLMHDFFYIMRLEQK